VDPRLRLLTMRAERDRECIKLIGTRFSAADLKFLHHLQQTLLGTSNSKAALEINTLLVHL
jgi:cellobiose-specific phosphotransferase system component IIA